MPVLPADADPAQPGATARALAARRPSRACRAPSSPPPGAARGGGGDAGRCSQAPSGARRAATSRGARHSPPLASTANAFASCMGVTAMPWPKEIVAWSIGRQLLPRPQQPGGLVREAAARSLRRSRTRAAAREWCSGPTRKAILAAPTFDETRRMPAASSRSYGMQVAHRLAGHAEAAVLAVDDLVLAEHALLERGRDHEGLRRGAGVGGVEERVRARRGVGRGAETGSGRSPGLRRARARRRCAGSSTITRPPRPPVAFTTSCERGLGLGLERGVERERDVAARRAARVVVGEREQAAARIALDGDALRLARAARRPPSARCPVRPRRRCSRSPPAGRRACPADTSRRGSSTMPTPASSSLDTAAACSGVSQRFTNTNGALRSSCARNAVAGSPSARESSAAARAGSRTSRGTA